MVSSLYGIPHPVYQISFHYPFFTQQAFFIQFVSTSWIIIYINFLHHYCPGVCLVVFPILWLSDTTHPVITCYLVKREDRVKQNCFRREEGRREKYWEMHWLRAGDFERTSYYLKKGGESKLDYLGPLGRERERGSNVEWEGVLV